MDYTIFENDPLQIIGIDESYNEELTAIEKFIASDILYTGNSSDIVNILPYFVFHRFCEKRRSIVTATTGEQSQVAEFTIPSYEMQKEVFNMGVEKLIEICLINNKSANRKYLLGYSLFGII